MTDPLKLHGCFLFAALSVLATEKVNQRLASYVKPDIDPGIEKDLKKYVATFQ